MDRWHRHKGQREKNEHLQLSLDVDSTAPEKVTSMVRNKGARGDAFTTGTAAALPRSQSWAQAAEIII